MFRYDLGQLTSVAAAGLPGAGGGVGAAGAGRVSLAAAPNPFTASSRLSFRLAEPMTVSLAIYDVRGRAVRRLVASSGMTAGDHDVAWDGRTDRGERAATGTYYARLVAGGRSSLKEIELLR